MTKKLSWACTVALAVFSMVAPAAALAVTGGHPSTAPYSFMGSLQRLDSPRPDLHVCGVELIAPRWALTAAHCTRTSADAIGRPTTGRPYDWKVRFGSTRVGSGGQLVRVTRFTQLNNRYFVDDLALLRLARPVDLAPIEIAAATPPPGTSVRIMGWGETCAGSIAPRCTPGSLREAETAIQPSKTCTAGAGNLCVGSLDGSVGPQNFDSGGPAIAMEDGRWRLVGTVEGGGSELPAIYTDVTPHRGWVNRFVHGEVPLPPDTPFPSDQMDGTVIVDGCAGAVVRGKESRPSDPAMMLTAGHCLQPRPEPGAAMVDRPYGPDGQYVYIGDRHGLTVDRARATKILYATMTGTDIAVVRLDQTYAELERLHVRPYGLAAEGPESGERLQVRSGSSGRTWTCRVGAIVPGLLEGGYRTEGAIRYRLGPGCSSRLGGGPSHGDSGAPLVDPSSGLIVGLHATTSDEGLRCAADNPCEVDDQGGVTSTEGRKYGEQTAALAPCLAAGSRVVLKRRDCTLTAHGAIGGDERQAPAQSGR